MGDARVLLQLMTWLPGRCLSQARHASPVPMLACLLLLLLAPTNKAQPDACDSDKAEYDVCVVGCGGSGAFTATKLKKMGYSVLVLEKQERCGGHCKTVQVPVPLPGGGGWLETGRARCQAGTLTHA